MISLWEKENNSQPTPCHLKNSQNPRTTKSSPALPKSTNSQKTNPIPTTTSHPKKVENHISMKKAT